MKTKIRGYIPNLLTMGSVAFGLFSILMSSQGNYLFAGYLIFGSFLMDALDGIIARKWKVQSMLGLQLDSMADMVGLGIAPLVLLFQHVYSRGSSGLWLIPFLIVAACCSAFRLARFNLLPPKSDNQKDSIGLSLFHTALTITVGVLSDLSYPKLNVPTWLYAGLLLVLSIMMISKLKFPPLAWFFSSWLQSAVIIICFSIVLLLLPLFTALLIFCFVHLLYSISRALYLKVLQEPATP